MREGARAEDVDVLYRGEQDCEKFRKILSHGRARYAMICNTHWARVFRRIARDAMGPSGGMADAEVSKTSDFGRVSSSLTSGTIAARMRPLPGPVGPGGANHEGLRVRGNVRAALLSW